MSSEETFECMMKLLAYAARDEPCSQHCCLSFLDQSMSLYIDMKMMRSSKLCGERFGSFSIISWTSRSSCSVVCTGKNLPLEHDWFVVHVVHLTTVSRVGKPPILPAHVSADCGYSGHALPRHSTEVRRDMRRCCQQLHSMFVYQRTFHPCTLIPINRIQSKCVQMLIETSCCLMEEQGP